MVSSRWNDFMRSKLLEGSQGTLVWHDVNAEDVDVTVVPSGFELPLAAQKMAQSGRYVENYIDEF